MNNFKSDTKATKTGTKVMLPVVELVIAIGLFTIISIFIVKFFTSANLMSREADERSKASIKAESIIELLKCFSPEEVTEKIGGKLIENKADKVIEVYYDESWNPVTVKNFKYSAGITVKDNPGKNGILQDINIMVVRKGTAPDSEKVLADIKGANYVKGGGNEK